MNTTTKTIQINNKPTIYTISTDGTITNTKTGKERKPTLSNGYLKITLRHEGKTYPFTVHRLLALHFISKPQDADTMVVDHINGNSQDNSLDNLQWVTQSENVLKASRPKTYNIVDKDTKIDIRHMFHEMGMSGREISEIYQIPLQTVYTICTRSKQK